MIFITGLLIGLLCGFLLGIMFTVFAISTGAILRNNEKVTEITDKTVRKGNKKQIGHIFEKPTEMELQIEKIKK